ncbi:MAG: hypothetical protein ACRD4B_09260, partial [Acidobacteriota bacterium]
MNSLVKFWTRLISTRLACDINFRALKRHSQFNRAVLGVSNPARKHRDIDLKTYVQYIPQERI